MTRRLPEATGMKQSKSTVTTNDLIESCPNLVIEIDSLTGLSFTALAAAGYDSYNTECMILDMM